MTAPDWFGAGLGRKSERRYWGKIQKELYEEYMMFVDQIKPPVDILIANGDLIDGRGELNGGTELTTNRVIEQCEMAVELIKLWEARKHIFLAGTAYHTGKLEDFEAFIANAFDAELKSHACIEIKEENVVLDVKHKIGRSSIPHGRATAALKEKMWNMLQKVREEAPLANLVGRSHVHYYIEIKDADGIAIVTPGLQAARTHFGERDVSGTVDWGLIHMEMDAGEVSTSGYKYIKKIDANKIEVITL